MGGVAAVLLTVIALALLSTGQSLGLVKHRRKQRRYINQRKFIDALYKFQALVVYSKQNRILFENFKGFLVFFSFNYTTVCCQVALKHNTFTWFNIFIHAPTLDKTLKHVPWCYRSWLPAWLIARLLAKSIDILIDNQWILDIAINMTSTLSKTFLILAFALSQRYISCINNNRLIYSLICILIGICIDFLIDILINWLIATLTFTLLQRYISCINNNRSTYSLICWSIYILIDFLIDLLIAESQLTMDIRQSRQVLRSVLESQRAGKGEWGWRDTPSAVVALQLSDPSWCFSSESSHRSVDQMEIGLLSEISR